MPGAYPLYLFSLFENNIRRDYDKVPLIYRRNTQEQISHLEKLELDVKMNEAFLKVLDTLRPLQGQVLPIREGAKWLAVYRIRGIPWNLYSSRVADVDSPQVLRHKVPDDYFYDHSDALAALEDDGVPPVTLLLTISNTCNVLGFSFFKPMFGKEAKATFLAYFNYFMAADALPRPRILAFSPPPSRIRTAPANLRIEMTLEQAHRMYRPSLDPGPFGDVPDVQIGSRILRLSKRKLQQIAERYAADVPQGRILGWSLAEIVTVAILWNYIMLDRMVLYRFMPRSSLRTSSRMDLMTSAHELIPQREYEGDLMSHLWKGNAEIPIVTTQQGSQFGDAFRDGDACSDAIRESIVELVASLSTATAAEVRRVAVLKRNLPLQDDLNCYNKALNSCYEGLQAETWSCLDCNSLDGGSELRYARPVLGVAKSDAAHVGRIRFLPCENDEEICVYVSLFQDECRLLRRILIGNEWLTEQGDDLEYF
ncbi:hypothetical protein QQS21_007132 [Conoideocrella luteorostrata]|uniref:Uncharacterized protein n=1 Tax=Conoideocrella luteorostrata TaxID=1105319 RepID=A0AAJ0CM76_9HYPO|nr:hypothetical protein QQS21_007132 [Conoideocrella luteorostrata]